MRRHRQGPGDLPWRPGSQWSQWQLSSTCTESPSHQPLQGRQGSVAVLSHLLQVVADLHFAWAGRGFPGEETPALG